MSSNLPPNTNPDSSKEVKSFFNSYFTEQISFPAADIDATVGFFEKRGFDKLASQSTAIILLQQAKIDNVNIFDLLDTLEGLSELQMSAIVTQVLNYNRQKTSTLGYRAETQGDFYERRNVLV